MGQGGYVGARNPAASPRQSQQENNRCSQGIVEYTDRRLFIKLEGLVRSLEVDCLQLPRFKTRCR